MEQSDINLSSRISQVRPSVTLKITAKAKELVKAGKSVINFAGGEPDFDTPDFIKRKAIKAIKEGFTKYTPSTGIIELKQAVCRYLQDTKDLKYSPDQIVIGCGAKHCLYNILQVICSKGKEVVIPAPYWVSYPEMVKLAQGIPKIVSTSVNNNFKITKDQLELALSNNSIAFILNSPTNPTGSVYSKQELLNLASGLKSKNIYTISDEIYDKLVYETSVTSIASIDEELKEKVILVGGVSKTYAMTGWRIGYLAGPKHITRAISSLQSHSTSNPCSISQKAALSALTEDQKFIQSMVDKFAERRKIMYAKLKDIPGILPFYPEGGFYIFCEISKITNDSLEFAKRLLEDKNVAVIPGIGFGYEGYVRMSFATSIEQIEEGTDRIKNWVERCY